MKSKSQLYSIWVRYRKNKLAITGTVIFAIILFFAIAAPLFASYDDDAVGLHISDRLQWPNSEHIFGTDSFGRDVFARVIYGARYSIGLGLAIMIIGLVGGVICGAVAGFYSGKIDGIIMRIMDIFLALPSTMLAIAVVAALGQGVWNLVIAMSISKIPQFARIVRSVVLPIRNREFVEAARSEGANNGYIIFRHILPNALGPIIVQATLDVSKIILAIASLSFVGLGVPAPIPEWGVMLSDAQSLLRDSAYLAIFPGLAICLTAMSLNLIGDGLRDALDPKQKN